MSIDDRDAPPLWCFVPLADYARPPEPAREKVRRGLWGVWDRLFSKAAPSGSGEAPVKPGQKDISKLNVKDPDWREAVPALHEVLIDWRASGREDGALKGVLNAPHSGVQQMVTIWALQNHFRVIDSPEAKQLLEGEMHGELDPDDETPWLIPALEKWYLRHHHSIDVVRRFLDILVARRSPTLICCDTWAWAYLNKTVDLDLVLPSPLVPAAFDRERLIRWLQALTRYEGGRTVDFRQSSNNRYVLPPADVSNDKRQSEISDFLGRLAAWSRGIPGIAWAYWCHSLSSAGLEGGETETVPRVPTVWMEPWQEIDVPAVPKHNRSGLAFVLHTLLLHNGVATEVLPELLPNLSHGVLRDLTELRAAGLVDEHHDVWRVTALGYPTVRAFLEGEGYLVDPI